jgi:hypothetical protein
MKHKRQHIVPACYLSAWLEPVTPPGQQRAIWKFAKDGSGAHRRSPKKTFVESDRFTVWLKSGERDLKVEHRLCEIENQFSEVLRRLHRGEKISIRDKAKLAVFTAAMLGRSRRAADHWKKVCPEHVADTIEFASSVLFGMNLHFFSAKDEVGFLTSDEPCIMHNPTAYRYHPMMRSPGLRQRHVEVVLPLSPRLLMVFSHQLAPPRIYSLSQQEVDQVNVVVVLAVTAASACIIPAWRASQLDPAQALRAE